MQKEPTTIQNQANEKILVAGDNVVIEAGAVEEEIRKSRAIANRRK
jgi:hypothetical protein